ncbi:MAG: bifunctional DNA-binding transcriptional regulator/O6-methylguanine-DNA methyltransferase Ada [Gemmatimonadota bacterium]|nr:bifunctional DNA-binding transcriptional regulator/O6-methylguanine-DNA methyltransferase Ada [Gemmatimonadota bacterium]
MNREITTPAEVATAWEAVTRRDATWDGRVIYAVTSTKIYCRPSCPSRRPRRDRVRFFPDTATAREAGFRACRRCHPDQLQPSRADQAIERARALLDATPDRSVSLAELAEASGLSPWHLQRIFRKVVGVSPRAYQAARRAERLKSGLRRESNVSQAAYLAGFGSGSRLYEQAHTLLGMTPGAYRRGGKGMEIRYTIVDSPLGRLLVGVTDRGVCAVAVGQSDTTLVRELAAEFPDAHRTRVDDGADAWLRDLIGRVAREVNHPGRDRTIPLDLQGTVFQWKVWQALQAIPAGETRSYTALARTLGSPRAVRAVAGACAANRVAVVVPCHRVIRGDGSLGGYRWGLPLKERLLATERAALA